MLVDTDWGCGPPQCIFWLNIDLWVHVKIQTWLPRAVEWGEARGLRLYAAQFEAQLLKNLSPPRSPILSPPVSFPHLCLTSLPRLPSAQNPNSHLDPAASLGLAPPSCPRPRLCSPWLPELQHPALHAAFHTSLVHARLGAFAHTYCLALPSPQPRLWLLLSVIWFQLL